MEPRMHFRYAFLIILYIKPDMAVVFVHCKRFVQDKLTWDNDRQMLWGPALLISPVLEAGKQAVEAYFPDARWFDYYR